MHRYHPQPPVILGTYFVDRDPYFENNASKHAAEAIRYDSQGFHVMAIESYQKAIEELVKFVLLHPNYKLNKIYMERAGAYQNRVKSLNKKRGYRLQMITCIVAIAYISCYPATSLPISLA